MRLVIVSSLLAVTMFALVSCVPKPEPSYPSYELIIGQYAPVDGIYQSEPWADATPSGCSEGTCSCPMVWYVDHYVYYCEGNWLYWHDNCWHWYPYFYIYYYNGAPYLYTTPVTHITQGPLGGEQSANPSPAGVSPFQGSTDYSSPPAGMIPAPSLSPSPSVKRSEPDKSRGADTTRTGGKRRRPGK